MTDKKREQIERGIRAKQLLENSLLIETFEHLDREFLNDLKSCEDPIKRDQIWNKLFGLPAFKACFNYYVINGKSAQKEIERK